MMVDHHVKYIELHGVDEVVEMTQSEHKLLHNRLRREGKCNVPPGELNKISTAAHNRGSKRKAYKKAHQQAYQAEHKEQRRAYTAAHSDQINARARARYAARKLEAMNR